MATVRCSKLPLALVCPEAIRDDGIARVSDGAPARLGTATHEWLAARIKGDTLDNEVLATKHRVDADDLGRSAFRAWKLWQQEAHLFGPSPEIEVALAKAIQVGEHELFLTGHVDLLFYDAEIRTVFVGDHKTGWLDADYDDQGRGYGYLALDLFPDAERVHIVFLRSREFTADHSTYERAQLEAWAEESARKLLAESGYNAGAHCRFCPRWHTCPEFRQFVSGAITCLTDVPAELEAAVSPDRLTHAYASLQALEKLTELARTAIKSHVAHMGGRVPLGCGWDLVIASQARNDIVYDLALPIMQQRIAAEKLPFLFKVAKGKVIEVLKADAPKGKKGAVVEAFMSELEAAGALDTRTSDRLERVRSEPEALTEDSSDSTVDNAAP